MKTPNEHRIKSGRLGSDNSYGNSGAFQVPSPIAGRSIFIISSDEFGWEHVSVTVRQGKSVRTATWDEMCFVKNLFWAEEETVVQFHPKKSEYVKNHSSALHLWKKTGDEFELPPSILVGVKEAGVLA